MLNVGLGFIERETKVLVDNFANQVDTSEAWSFPCFADSSFWGAVRHLVPTPKS